MELRVRLFLYLLLPVYSRRRLRRLLMRAFGPVLQQRRGGVQETTL